MGEACINHRTAVLLHTYRLGPNATPCTARCEAADGGGASIPPHTLLLHGRVGWLHVNPTEAHSEVLQLRCPHGALL